MTAQLTARSTRRREIFDFAVVGDGPVGLLAAIALHKQGRAVALLVPEAFIAPDFNSAPADLRVYALAPDVLSFLADQGCAVAAHPRASAYSSMVVFDQDPNATLRFDGKDYGWTELGSIVEHQLLQALLWQEIARLELKIVLGKANCYELDAGVAILHTHNATVRTRWVIDASGAASTLRDAAGIRTHAYDYQQSAIVAHVRTESGHANTAWQRFISVGTIALLPMFDGTHALVYAALEAKAQALMQADDRAFLADLDVEFGNTLGKFTEISARRKIPLRRLLAENYLADPLILLGDSAHTVHPLAGQGLNLGIRDVQCLSAAIASSAHAAEMGGALKRYARERKSENAITAYGIENLQKLFLPTSGPAALLRHIGLSGVNRLVPLKRLFAELAAGKVAGWP